MHREATDLLVGEPQPHRHVVEAAARENHVPGVLDLLGVDQAEGGQPPQRVVEVRDLFADQLELVGGLVVGEDLAVAVQDQAAAGRNRVEAHAVALRQFDVVVVPPDLQEHQTADQRQHQCADHDHGPERALREDALLVPAVLDPNAR